MVLQSGGFKNKERCCKLPLSTGPKPTNRGYVRSYSWRFAIATWKVAGDPRARNNRG
jgi:hypothetical protein